MNALYQICEGKRPFIQTRQAQAHDLAEHLLHHPFWMRSVRPLLDHARTSGSDPPLRDGLEESADRVYLPRGIPADVLIALQAIVDGWVTNIADA